MWLIRFYREVISNHLLWIITSLRPCCARTKLFCEINASKTFSINKNHIWSIKNVMTEHESKLTCYECFPQWRIFIWSLWNYFKEIISNEQNGVWTIAPEENFPPNNCLRGQLLLNYCSPTITPKIIAPWQYTPGNCPRGKLPFGWFVAYIIAPRTNGPEENCPAGKLSQG